MTRVENGAAVSDYWPEVVRVFGGYQIIFRRWRRTLDGWDYDDRPSGDPRLYKTYEDASAALTA